MDRVREAVVHGGGQWIHDGIARVTHGARVIAVSGPEAAPHDDGRCPRPLRAQPANLEDVPPRRLRPRPGRASAWLPAGRLRVSRPPVSGSDLLPVLLPESSAWFDTARRQPRGQRSRCRSAGGVLEKWCCAMSDAGSNTASTRAHGRLRASLVSLTCLLRGLPLFFRAAPKTPLRVLCIVALDTLHVLRHSQPLPRKRISELATFLDFQGVHERGLGSQGSVRGGIPGDPAAAGEGRPRAVHRGVSRSASGTGKPTARQSAAIIGVSTKFVRTARRSRGCRLRRLPRSR